MVEEKQLRMLSYNRVSTQRQAVEGYNLEGMAGRIERYCEDKRWVLVQSYTDAGRSARTIKHRPEYLRMMERLREDETVDGIIVYKLDRIHRNLRNALRFFDEIIKLDKEFVSVHDTIDTSTAMGRAMLRFMLVLNPL